MRDPRMEAPAEENGKTESNLSASRHLESSGTRRDHAQANAAADVSGVGQVGQRLRIVRRGRMASARNKRGGVPTRFSDFKPEYPSEPDYARFAFTRGSAFRMLASSPASLGLVASQAPRCTNP